MSILYVFVIVLLFDFDWVFSNTIIINNNNNSFVNSSISKDGIYISERDVGGCCDGRFIADVYENNKYKIASQNGEKCGTYFADTLRVKDEFDKREYGAFPAVEMPFVSNLEECLVNNVAVVVEIEDGVVTRDVHQRTTFIFSKTNDLLTVSWRCHASYTNRANISIPSYLQIPVSKQTDDTTFNQRLINGTHVKLSSCIVSSSQYFTDHYYHMISEKVFPLGAALPLLDEDKEMKVIVEASYPQIIEFYELLGISKDRIVVVNDAKGAYCRKLYIPLTSECYWTSAGNVQGIRQRLMTKHPAIYNINVNGTNHSNHGDRPTIVIIHRNETVCDYSHRCLNNTIELYHTIESEYGSEYDVVIFNASPMFHTMKLFARASLIIGPHGAGFTNLVFAKPNTGVIEIQNKSKYFFALFHVLSAQLSLSYRGIRPAVITHHDTKTDLDFLHYDIPLTMKYVKELISQRNQSK